PAPGHGRTPPGRRSPIGRRGQYRWHHGQGCRVHRNPRTRGRLTRGPRRPRRPPEREGHPEMKTARGGIVTGWGIAVPDKIVTNDDLSVTMDTNDAWIQERTGIRERRIGGTTSPTAT